MALERWQIDFLSKLCETGNDPCWQLHSPTDMIRRETIDRLDCPVSAVAAQKTGRYFGIGLAMRAASAIGLSPDEARIILASSDNHTDHGSFNGELRSALLEATGLNQKENV